MPIVPRLFPNSTIVCLGTGPSLTAADVDVCRGKAVVIAINDAYRIAPWAEVLYACDAAWWKRHNWCRAFAGMKVSLETSAWRQCGPGDPAIVRLRNAGDSGLELDPTGLRTGKNSGYQALNLAVHLGARRIVLLGYDMDATNRKPAHFFGDHPNPIRSPYALFRQHFETLVQPLRTAGITVINATPGSALTCFPRLSLADGLAGEAVAA